MITPLLATKLYVPPSRLDLVSRPRLIEELNTGLSRKLTLISAPAGFGKTTLLSSWTDCLTRPVTWLSLDDSDNDLSRFLTYLIAALQTIDGDIGRSALVVLQSPGDLNIEVVLAILISEMAELPDGVVIVLDDYHVIESPQIDQIVAFLLDYLPEQNHIVIASRIDPSLPLSRLRARGQMTEIRVNNLRFTTEEAIDLFNQMKDLDLPKQDVTALEKRTEGWIAGLQLAALSLRGFAHRRDIADFVNRFTGSDRYIQDYLVDEVLQQQSKEVQDFLLTTSILKRFSGPLCDTLRFGADNSPSRSSETASQTILENLETTNLFIIPLDNDRNWYRYHHLFADLLMHRLRIAFPDRVPELHLRASLWYQNADQIDDAIRHAQASEKPQQLSEILEEKWQVLIHRGEFAKLRNLLDSLGPEITKGSAPLSMAYCWIGAMTGAIDSIRSHIRDIRTVINDSGKIENLRQPNRITVIPSLVETMEAIIALDENQVERAKEHAVKAISIIPDVGNPEVRGLLGGAAGYRLAEAHKKLGELDEAYEVLLEVLEMLKTSNNYYGAVATLQQIVEIYQKLGKIGVGITLCEDTLQFMKVNHWEKMPPSGVVYVILADLQADSGQFDDALRNLEIGRKIIKPIESPQILSHVKRVEEKLAYFTSDHQLLIEPLSDRELEVLQLVAQGLTNRGISERLYLALDTVKGHNRKIFRKLGVKNRAQAINKAILLKIITH